MQYRYNRYETYQTAFSLKAWAPSPGGQRTFFFRIWSCCIATIKGNDACINMVANALPIDPLLGVGSKRQNSTFSEHGHVAYQMKRNDECSNIQTHILSLKAPSMVGSNVVVF